MNPLKAVKHIIDTKLSEEDENILFIAIRNNTVATVIKILNKGIDVNSNIGNAGTLLCYAAYRGHLDLVEALVMRGADVNLESICDGTFIEFPLMRAVEAGHYCITQYLIKNKADLNLQNEKGYTPLHEAVLHENARIRDPGWQQDAREILKALLRAKADVNIKNIYGRRPIGLVEPRSTMQIEYVFKEIKNELKEREKAKKKAEQKKKAEDLLLSDKALEFEIENEDQIKGLISRMRYWFKKGKKKSSESTSPKHPKR